LLLRNTAGVERVEEADVVLDCTGTYGIGRHLGDGGIPAVGELKARPHIASGVEDIQGEKRDQYADRNILVVGSGHSAATTVCLLAGLAQKHPSTWVVWLARAAGSQPIRRVMNDPMRERDLIASRANMLATRGEGHIEFYPSAVIDTVEHQGKDGFLVSARVNGASRDWVVDRVLANVGCEPDNRLYRELQVHECPALLAPMNLAMALNKNPGSDAIPALGANTLRTPEPNFFILGMKSYGRLGNFLLRTGFEQVREVFTLLCGSSEIRGLEQRLPRGERK
jgi:hypothetical protein